MEADCIGLRSQPPVEALAKGVKHEPVRDKPEGQPERARAGVTAGAYASAASRAARE
jgi:hypothetical protein